MEIKFDSKTPSAAPAPTEITAAAVPATPPVPTAPVPPPATLQQAADAHADSIALAPASSPGGLVIGQDRLPEFKDIILPRLNIVQGLGQLKDTFPQGGLVFNQQALLFQPAVIDKATGNVSKPGLPPVIVTCLGFRPTRFVEKVSGGARGMIVDTEDAVRAAGGTLDYSEFMLKKKDGMKRFEQLADGLFAIERPECVADDDSFFVYPVGGKKYALAIFGMKGTAYTEAAKRVFFTARAAGCLSKGYPTRSFAMSTRWKNFDGGNGTWVPVLIPHTPSTPEFMDWVGKVLKG
jgi:hypothetical protein